LYIVRLKLFNLELRNFENSVQMAAVCKQEQIPKVVEAAVYKLQGLAVKKSGLKIFDYKGKEVNHQLQWGVIAAAAVAGGIFWASQQGALSPDVSGKSSEAEFAGTLETDLSNSPGFFSSFALSPRASGMGGAFSALADDATGFVANPAGLVRTPGRQFAVNYFNLYELYPYLSLGYVDKITRTSGFGVGLIHSGSEDKLSEESVILTGVSKLFESVPFLRSSLSVGINAKMYVLSVSKDPLDTAYYQQFATYGKGFGYGFDFGIQTPLTRKIIFSIVLKDAFSSINNTRFIDSDSGDAVTYGEGVPATLVIGGYYKANVFTNLVLDGEKSLHQDVSDKISMGGETLVFKILKLRAGFSQYFSFDPVIYFTVGGGLYKAFKKNKNVSFDFAYQFAKGNKTFNGTKRFGLNFTF